MRISKEDFSIVRIVSIPKAVCQIITALCDLRLILVHIGRVGVLKHRRFFEKLCSIDFRQTFTQIGQMGKQLCIAVCSDSIVVKRIRFVFRNRKSTCVFCGMCMNDLQKLCYFWNRFINNRNRDNLLIVKIEEKCIIQHNRLYLNRNDWPLKVQNSQFDFLSNGL